MDVSDNLFTGDLDVASVQTRGQFAALLRTVHVRADKPSLRALEARTRHGAAPLSKSAVSQMLNGVRFPRKAVMISFLRACGVPEEMMEPWRRGWERLAEAEQDGVARHQPVGERDRDPATAFRAAQRLPDVRADAPLTPSADKSLPLAGLAASQESEPKGPPGAAEHRGTLGPLARRRELGALLRDLRSQSGLTIDQVAESLMCSPSKVSRMETGFRSGTLRDIRDLCDLYRVDDGRQREYLMELAREGKRPGWWQSHDVPFGFGTYIGLEADATFIRSYNTTMVPGLLQTEDYARALLREGYGPDYDSERVEELVTVRLRRQRVLSQEFPLQLHVLMDEAALHRAIGGPAVMKVQLDHILRQATLSNITVQVIPYRRGFYWALDNSFCILEFPQPMHEIAYAEGIFGFVFLERQQDVDRCLRIFHDTQEIALSSPESLELIAQISVRLSGG